MVEMLENSHCEYYISTMHTHKQTHIYIVYIYILNVYIYRIYMIILFAIVLYYKKSVYSKNNL